MDRDNPRSLGWVVQTLRGRLAKLGGNAPGELGGLALHVPDPGQWRLEQLCEITCSAPDVEAGAGDEVENASKTGVVHGRLAELLQQCRDCAFQISDEISITYFTHAGTARQTGGS